MDPSVPMTGLSDAGCMTFIYDACIGRPGSLIHVNDRLREPAEIRPTAAWLDILVRTFEMLHPKCSICVKVASAQALVLDRRWHGAMGCRSNRKGFRP
jgi:hypothetical protein